MRKRLKRNRLHNTFTKDFSQEYTLEVWREGDRWDTRKEYNAMDWMPENNNCTFSNHEDRDFKIFLKVHRFDDKIDLSHWSENF